MGVATATAFAEVRGGRIVYELLGPDSGTPIVLTPGGRFSKDVPGLRPLAARLAEGGLRVLLWDRPNTGASDVQFWGETESQMKADVLAGLLRELNLAPAVITGGSGGARDAIVTALSHPEIVRQLIVWNIVGGFVTTMALAQTFCLPSIMTAYGWGIEGVVEMPEWRARIEANPRNRERILSMGREGFLDLMTRWAYAFVPRAAHTVPGVRDLDVATITVPTAIVRPGERDINHPLQVARDVHTLIHGSRLVDPPWPDGDAMWEEALRAGHDRHFIHWPDLAPLILDLIESGAPVPR